MGLERFEVGRRTSGAPGSGSRWPGGHAQDVSSFAGRAALALLPGDDPGDGRAAVGTGAGAGPVARSQRRRPGQPQIDGAMAAIAERELGRGPGVIEPDRIDPEG